MAPRRDVLNILRLRLKPAVLKGGRVGGRSGNFAGRGNLHLAGGVDRYVDRLNLIIIGAGAGRRHRGVVIGPHVCDFIFVLFPLRGQRDIRRYRGVEIVQGFTQVPAEELAVVLDGICRTRRLRALLNPLISRRFNAVLRHKGDLNGFDQLEHITRSNPHLVLRDRKRIGVCLDQRQFILGVAIIGPDLLGVIAAECAAGNGHRGRTAGICTAVHHKCVARGIATVAVIRIRRCRPSAVERAAGDIQLARFYIHRRSAGDGTAGNVGYAAAGQIHGYAAGGDGYAVINVDSGIVCGGTVGLDRTITTAINCAVHIERIVRALDQHGIPDDRDTFSNSYRRVTYIGCNRNQVITCCSINEFSAFFFTVINNADNAAACVSLRQIQRAKVA